MVNTKLFRKLRGKLAELSYDEAYLAKKSKLSVMTISRSLTGKRPWQLNEMYAVMDLINEPYELLHDYFPKSGISQNIKPAKAREAPVAPLADHSTDQDYREQLINIALRILYELDGKVICPMHLKREKPS